MIFIENKSKRELTDPSLLNSTNPLDDSVTSIGKPTPLTNKFSFMNENEALIIKDANRLMWMVVRGQRSFLFQDKKTGIVVIQSLQQSILLMHKNLTML